MTAGDRVYLEQRVGMVVSVRRAIAVIALWNEQHQRVVTMTVSQRLLTARDEGSAYDVAFKKAVKA